MFNFFQLKGQVIKEISGLEEGSDEVLITTNEGVLRLYHAQDCCESVKVQGINEGSIPSVLNGFVILAEEDAVIKEENYGRSTVTTFIIKTQGVGFLKFSFWGESNGFYSEAVDLSFQKFS